MYIFIFLLLLFFSINCHLQIFEGITFTFWNLYLKISIFFSLPFLLPSCFWLWDSSLSVLPNWSLLLAIFFSWSPLLGVLFLLPKAFLEVYEDYTTPTYNLCSKHFSMVCDDFPVLNPYWYSHNIYLCIWIVYSSLVSLVSYVMFNRVIGLKFQQLDGSPFWR